jgi:hypothetical protein
MALVKRNSRPRPPPISLAIVLHLAMLFALAEKEFGLAHALGRRVCGFVRLWVTFSPVSPSEGGRSGGSARAGRPQAGRQAARQAGQQGFLASGARIQVPLRGEQPRRSEAKHLRQRRSLQHCVYPRHRTTCSLSQQVVILLEFIISALKE